MKKNIRIIMAALVVLSAASCQKEGVRTLTATFEQFENGSKAYIDDEYYACWEHNDMVAINGTPCAVSLTTGSSHANSAEITIPGTLSGENLLAFYPAGRISDMDATGGTVDFPHIQTYRVNADGVQVIDNPMAAYCPSDGEVLKFHNLGSLLKVTIPNNEDIKAIQVKGIDNQMLCGKSQLRFDHNGNPSLSSCTGGSSSVTLRFPGAVRANGKSFYIVLPPNANFETLTIAVLTDAGTAWVHHAKTTIMDRTLNRNHIATISYDLSHHDDNDFVADWTIRYTATERVVPSDYEDWGTFGATEAAYDFSGSKGLIVFNDIITKIGIWKFSDVNSLQSINLPESVTEIGSSAFNRCWSLTYVSMPGVITIESEAFASCGSLATVEMPSVITIGRYAFGDCGLTVVSLPSATTIGENAFRNCAKLVQVSMPNVTAIGKYAFYRCIMTSVSLPSATTIGIDAFNSCGMTSVSLPIATTIGEGAFRGCANLTTISMPNVTTVGRYAFGDCGMTSVSLPSATTIGENAFRNCAKLVSVSLPSATTIGNGAFYNCSLPTISLPSVTTIEGHAFRACAYLTAVELPHVTTIGESAFLYSENIADVYSTTAAPTVASYAFSSVSSSAVLHLPSSLSGSASVSWDGWPGTIVYDYNE